MADRNIVRAYVLRYGKSFDITEFLPVFSAERMQKIKNCKRHEARMQLAAAELVICTALRAMGRNDVPPKYGYYENGAPYIDDGFISISHTNGIAACAVSNRRLGIDVERPRPMKRLRERLLCSEELKELDKLKTFKELEKLINTPYTESSPALMSHGMIRDNSEGFRTVSASDIYLLQAWTAKESFLKLSGEGLGGGMRSLRYDRSTSCLQSLTGDKRCAVFACWLPSLAHDVRLTGEDDALFSICVDGYVEFELEMLVLDSPHDCLTPPEERSRSAIYTRFDTCPCMC